MYQTFAVRDANLGMAWCAVQLKLYRETHGRYPAALSELTQHGARLPTDPFNDQPYHYRLEGSGFRLWSVGTNGVDDGGTDEDGKIGGPPRPIPPHLQGPGIRSDTVGHSRAASATLAFSPPVSYTE